MTPATNAQTDHGIRCLDQYAPYQRLQKRRATLERIGMPWVVGPAIWVIGLGVFFPHTRQTLIVVLVLVSLLWALGIVALKLGLSVYWAGINCPRCHRRFGTEDECWSCGLSRHCS